MVKNGVIAVWSCFPKLLWGRSSLRSLDHLHFLLRFFFFFFCYSSQQLRTKRETKAVPVRSVRGLAQWQTPVLGPSHMVWTGHSFHNSIKTLTDASTKQSYPFHSFTFIIQFLSWGFKFPLREWSYTSQAVVPWAITAPLLTIKDFLTVLTPPLRRCRGWSKNNSSCCWLGARLEVWRRARTLGLDDTWSRSQPCHWTFWPLGRWFKLSVPQFPHP